MRGLEQLRTMRRGGLIPTGVWVDCDSERPAPMADDWHTMPGARAHLQTEPGDRALRLDLRCVIGLPCYVDGSNRDQVFAMRQALLAAKAARVIAWVMERMGAGEFVTYRLVEMTDSAGVHDWTKTTEDIHG